METIRHLGHRMRVLSQALCQSMDRTLTELDLTAIQSFILRYMETCEETVVYPKDIEKRFHLTHPTVSGILQRMEDKGFIRMQTDPDDHRCKRVERTEKAVRCQQAICQRICMTEQAMTAGMSEEEVTVFIGLHDRAIENMQALDSYDTKEEPTVCSNV